MDAAAAARKQDMPPSGGYKPISFKRIPPKSYFSGSVIMGGYLAIATGGLYLYYLNCKQVHRDEIEMRSARLAVYPMLLAERDREYLKQIRRNRDEEAKLMAKVEGWKVGTYYGEPLYRTLPKDTFRDPTMAGYYVHASEKDFFKRSNIGSWS